MPFRPLPQLHAAPPGRTNKDTEPALTGALREPCATIARRALANRSSSTHASPGRRASPSIFVALIASSTILPTTDGSPPPPPPPPPQVSARGARGDFLSQVEQAEERDKQRILSGAAPTPHELALANPYAQCKEHLMYRERHNRGSFVLAGDSRKEHLKADMYQTTNSSSQQQG